MQKDLFMVLSPLVFNELNSHQLALEFRNRFDMRVYKHGFFSKDGEIDLVVKKSPDIGYWAAQNLFI